MLSLEKGGILLALFLITLSIFTLAEFGDHLTGFAPVDVDPEIPPPPCKFDSDCRDGFVCIGVECVLDAGQVDPEPCRRDRDCEEGQTCDAGKCKDPAPPEPACVEENLAESINGGFEEGAPAADYAANNWLQDPANKPTRVELAGDALIGSKAMLVQQAAEQSRLVNIIFVPLTEEKYEYSVQTKGRGEFSLLLYEYDKNRNFIGENIIVEGTAFRDWAKASEEYRPPSNIKFVKLVIVAKSNSEVWFDDLTFKNICPDEVDVEEQCSDSLEEIQIKQAFGIDVYEDYFNMFKNCGPTFTGDCREQINLAFVACSENQNDECMRGYILKNLEISACFENVFVESLCADDKDNDFNNHQDCADSGCGLDAACNIPCILDKQCPENWNCNLRFCFSQDIHPSIPCNKAFQKLILDYNNSIEIAEYFDEFVQQCQEIVFEKASCKNFIEGAINFCQGSLKNSCFEMYVRDNPENAVCIAGLFGACDSDEVCSTGTCELGVCSEDGIDLNKIPCSEEGICPENMLCAELHIGNGICIDSPTYCDDEVDNDEDGKIDCSDTDCNEEEACAPECTIDSDCGANQYCDSNTKTCMDRGSYEGGGRPGGGTGGDDGNTQFMTCEEQDGVYCGSGVCAGDEISISPYASDYRDDSTCCEPLDGTERGDGTDSGNAVCRANIYDPSLGEFVNAYTTDCFDPDGDGYGFKKTWNEDRSAIINEEPCTTITNENVPFFSIISLVLSIILISGFYLKRKTFLNN